MTRWHWQVMGLLLTAGLLLGQGSPRRGSPRKGAPETAGAAVGAAVDTPADRVRLSAGARAALATARAAARQAQDLDGDEQLAALASAAEAHDRVASDFAAEPAAAAEAEFRAAELWRSHGDAQRAEQDYLAAARTDAARFGQRGKLGAADMQRRQERLDEALASYGEAAALEPGTARAHTARLWRGRLLLRLERPAEAVAAFRAAVDAAASARQVVDASNGLARLLVDQGDLEGAAAALARADAAVGSAILEHPDRADSLQRALQSMSARRALQRARDRQTGAARDAAALEAARGK